jgi:hypothetical protein
MDGAIWKWLIDHPEAWINAIGFVVIALALINIAQKRRTPRDRGRDFKLELETSRIFQVGIQYPDIPRYIYGELPPARQSPELHEQCHWYVCDTLNLFEIMISGHQEKLVSSDTLSAWVTWFHKIGTAERFSAYWIERRLWPNYKSNLQRIMGAAQELRANRMKNAFSMDEELQVFYKTVADVLQDRSLLTYYQKSRERNRKLALQIASAEVAAAA